MKIIIQSILGLLLAMPALALPVGENIALHQPLVLIFEESAEYDFNGIVRLSNCSASLVRFPGQPDDSKAYVLTNGHCLQSFFGGFLQPGEVRFDQPSSRSMDIFIDINQTVSARADRLVYGTMTDTDAALYRLTDTYAALRKLGVEAFELSEIRPILNEEIKIVSGYWRRGFDCSIEHFVHELREADWTMHDSLRYSTTGCEVYGGTSGSPIIRKGERVVIGINNTGNEDGGQCTMNNPCEVDEQGNTTVLPGRGYGQQVYWFSTCLAEDFSIDLTLAGCLLPKPEEVSGLLVTAQIFQ